VFAPSDPEWPAYLGIRTMALRLLFPSTYPHAHLSLHVADFSVPQPIQQFIDSAAERAVTQIFM
jgi:hypothetical protein